MNFGKMAVALVYFLKLSEFSHKNRASGIAKSKTNRHLQQKVKRYPTNTKIQAERIFWQRQDLHGISIFIERSTGSNRVSAKLENKSTPKQPIGTPWKA